MPTAWNADARPGLVDARVHDLAGLGLLVGEHELAVHGHVVLAVRVEDLGAREDRVQAERAGLVGDDRHQAVAELLVPDEVLEQADERLRRRDVLVAGALGQAVVDLVVGQRQRLVRGAPLGHEPAELATTLEHVLDALVLGARVEVRREVRVRVDLLVRDRDVQRVAQRLEVVALELLHLVRGVAPGEAGAQAVALDGVRQDDRRLPRVLAGGLVGGVDLAVVVPAALERPDLVVGHLLDERLGPRVAAEEVLADERAVLGPERLEVAVGRRVHQVDERAVLVGVEQGVPLAAPDDLDDVPAGAAELRLELLDDLAVAAHRAVEPLQVAVDDEREVVQALLAGQLEHAAGLGLVHLAVAEERPDVLLAGVLDAAQVQVPVGPRLVDRRRRAEAHRDGRELPQVRREARVRVGRQAAARVRQLLAEPVELVLGQAALEERAGVDAGGGVALEVDLVAAAGVVLAAEEVVEAHLGERRDRRVRRDVPADADRRAAARA